MKDYNLIVIGGDGAGMGAASQARRVLSDISIAVFERGNHISYAGCGIPYFLGGMVENSSSLQAIDREKFSEKKNIQIHIKTEVTEVDFKEKVVTFNSRGNIDTVKYDKLIIATGASPIIPPIGGMDNENVFLLRNLQHGLDIHGKLKSGAKSVILVGGGFINLELAEAFRAQGLEVTLIERLDSVAPQSSPEIQEKIQEVLRSNGVNLLQGTTISNFTGSGKSITAHTDNGDFTADFAVVSTGVSPATDFLKDSGLPMMPNGAIIIDEKSQTAMKDVFAAGDCATVKNLLTGKDDYMPIATTANKQGRVAGLQAAGVTTEYFPGAIGSQMFKVFNLEVAKTGFNLRDSEKHGFDAEEKSIVWHSRAGYYEKSAKVVVNLTVLKKDGTVIGGEICGEDYAGLRIHTIAAAVSSGMKVEDLAYLDLAYAPPFSPVWDPVIAAAQTFLVRESSGFGY